MKQTLFVLSITLVSISICGTKGDAKQIEEIAQKISEMVSIDENLLFGAAKNGDQKKINGLCLPSELLERINKKVVTEKCKEVLFYSSYCGYIDRAKMLIENCGVDPKVKNIKSSSGTALHIASEEGHSDFVKYLIDEQNFDLNAPDANGWTPLHLAAKGDHCDVVKFLVGAGAHRCVRTKKGGTPWSLALQFQAWNVLSYIKGEVVNDSECCCLCLKKNKRLRVTDYYCLSVICIDCIKKLKKCPKCKKDLHRSRNKKNDS